MLEALVVTINLASMTDEVMSPYLEPLLLTKDHGWGNCLHASLSGEMNMKPLDHLALVHIQGLTLKYHNRYKTSRIGRVKPKLVPL
jgi:hypothetical protein